MYFFLSLQEGEEGARGGIGIGQHVERCGMPRRAWHENTGTLKLSKLAGRGVLPIPPTRPHRIPLFLSTTGRSQFALAALSCELFSGQRVLCWYPALNQSHEPRFVLQFKLIRKAYYQKSLKTHPDKGGDTEEFKKVRSAFEVLKEIFEASGVPSFSSSGDCSTSAAFSAAQRTHRNFPSWDFYQAASEEPVPLYRVELAKSDRSKCAAKGSAAKCFSDKADLLITKGSIRIGSLNDVSGSYGRWIHLECWRIPSKVRKRRVCSACTGPRAGGRWGVRA